MADRKDRLGQQFGEYLLLRWLGGGGFGDVYLAEHVHTHAQTAVKVLQAQLTQKDELKEFINEARTFRLKHPNIVPLLDFGIGPDDLPFLVMEYAPNGTLRQRHPKGTRLSFSTLLSYVTPIASALQYAHSLHLVHRDVKSENMLVGAHGEILLSDFGIAIVAQSSRSLATQEGIGTLPYMAPEQIRGKPLPASDQYALGVVVYEWLSGTRPFNGTSIELMTQHLVAPAPPLRLHVPTLPAEVERVVLTALAKDPKERFVSVQEFAEALARAGQPAQPSPMERTASPAAQREQPTITVIPTEKETTQQPSPGQSLQQVGMPPLERKADPVRQNISRRTMVLGVGLAGLAIAGGGTAWLVSSLSHRPTESSIARPSRLLYIYRGHALGVTSLAWSPVESRIASASVDATVQVWDAANGGRIFTYREHAAIVDGVAWSPDGTRIASAGEDYMMRVWNTAVGAQSFLSFPHPTTATAVGWSKDNIHVASGCLDAIVRIWDTNAGAAATTLSGHSSAVWSVAWSPDGTRLASASADTTVRVWNIAKGGNPFIYSGHSDRVWSVAWSPDGKRVASASQDGTVQMWNATDGSNVFTYRGHSGDVYAVAWSPSGTLIASGGDDKTVQVWNAATGRLSMTYRGHSNTVQSVVWSPNGKLIASGGADKTVQVWQAPG